MKKVLLLIAISVLPTFAFAQFILKTDRFVSEDGKNYVVFEHPNMTQKELYSKVKNILMSLYASPDDVISENEGEMLSLRGINSRGAYMDFKLMGKYYIDILFKMDIMFKEGRFRIDAPTILRLDVSGKNSQMFLECGSKMAGCVYTKKGDARYPELIASLEKSMNDLVNYINLSIENPVDEDW